MKRLIMKSVLVAAMVICTAGTSDAWIFSRGNTATKTALGGQELYFQSMETNTKAALKAAKDLKSAFLDFSDARTQLGSAGKGEIEAIINYLDAVQAAAKDIRQAERDDVMVPKVVKTFSAPSKCFTTITMLIERHLSAALQPKNATPAKITKFYTAFTIFTNTVSSISLPQAPAAISSALADYAYQMVASVRSLIEAIAAFQSKIAATPQLQQALAQLTQPANSGGYGTTTTTNGYGYAPITAQPSVVTAVANPYGTTTSSYGGYTTVPAVSTPAVSQPVVSTGRSSRR
ncbi:MAG: hypothetical protein LBT67_01065 [Holosporaceae bacterium]|jgi:hypothetical protein|nr:hypothetical protein [Holosporaceae bacterium]